MDNISRKITLAGETAALTALSWASTSTAILNLELHNLSAVSTTENKIGVVRGDLMEATVTVPSEADAVSNSAGKELCIEQWLEVRLNAGDSWHAVDGYSNCYDIGAISAGSSKTFDVRLNIPSSVSSIGTVGFAIRVLSR